MEPLSFYGCFPVDWWHGSHKFKVDNNGNVTERPKSILQTSEDASEDDADWPDFWKEFDQLVYAAFLGFRDLGWDGFTRSGYWSCWTLPNPDGGGYFWVVAAKHDNNGDTFIASQVPLPYLEHTSRSFKVMVRNG